MIKYIKAVFELKTIIKCNMLIYYLEKIPILGKHISYFLFRHTEVKKVIAVIAAILSILALTVVKSICILVFVFFAIPWLSGKTGMHINDYNMYYYQAIFFLFCVLGAFQESRTFLVSKTKYICLALIKMPVKEGILSFLINEYAIQFISIVFVFGIHSVLIFHNYLYFISLIIAYISMQLLSECIHLFFFKCTLKPLEKKKIFSAFLIALALVGAYGPIVITEKLLIVDFLNNKFILLAFMLISIASFYYIFVLFNGYNDELARLFKTEDLVDELARKKQEAIYDTEVDIDLTSSQKIKDIRGFKLVNYLFVLRNRKHLFKYFKRRVVFLIIVFAMSMISLFNDPIATTRILNNIYRFVPVLPIIIGLFAYGEGFCKFYYNNCDSKLLVYNFYRTRKAILDNYFIKLKNILKYNLILGVVTVTFILILFAVAKIEIMNFSFFLFEFTIFVLILVFGIQHLSVYYIFQPYVKESTIQNPILFIIQMPMIILTYIFAMLSLPPILIMLVFLVAGLIYAIVLIGVVCIKCSSTFKLK